MAFFLHFHDDTDFKEEEHPRDEDGKFVKGAGAKGAKKGATVAQGFQFAPTEKKHIVANEISHVLKAHQYIKQKKMTPGGHYIFEHPNGHKVHVGPAFQNQTYSKGWRHTEGTGGAGGASLEKYLASLHGKKEVPPPKTKAKQVTGGEFAKPAPTPTPAPTPAKPEKWDIDQHGYSSVLASAATGSGAAAFEPENGHYKTKQGVHVYIDHPDDTSKPTLTSKWIVYTPNPEGSSAAYTKTEGYGGAPLQQEIEKADKQAVKNKGQPPQLKNQPVSLPANAIAPSKAEPYKDDIGFNHIAYQWDKGHTVVDLTIEGPDAGNWSIDTDQGVSNGSGQASFEAEFAKLNKTKGPGEGEKLHIPSYAQDPIQHFVTETASGTSVQVNEWSGQNGGTFSTQIKTEGPGEGDWKITTETGEDFTGKGQKSFNEKFEALHPRGPGGKFAKKPGGSIIDHLEQNGWKYKSETEKYYTVTRTNEQGDEYNIRVNKETGAWRINEGSYFFDSGDGDDYQSMYQALDYLGFQLPTLPKDWEAGPLEEGEPEFAPKAEPPPTKYIAHPSATVEQTTTSLGFESTAESPGLLFYKDPHGNELIVAKKPNAQGDYAWSFTPADNPNNTLGGQNMVNLKTNIGNYIGSHFPTAGGAAPTPAAPTPTPTPAALSTDHPDPQIHLNLANQGFTSSETKSTVKNRYDNKLTGSKIYITKQAIMNGQHEWSYYPPGEAYNKITGYGMAGLNATIKAHETPPKQVITTTLNQAHLKKVGPQHGSNPGGEYEDPSGNKYYIKQTPSINHSRNEFLAAALFGLAGGNTFTYHQVVDGNNLNVGTDWEVLPKKNLKDLTPAEKTKAKQDFALQCWIANWDAVGTGGDNIGVDDEGNIKCLDFGGSLLFRAQGQPKGSAFNNNVDEWLTLRDPQMNSDAASLYNNMTSQELKDSAERLKNITKDQISQLVNQYGAGGANDKEAMINTLVARRDAILAKVGLVANAYNTGKETITKPKVKVPTEQIQQSIEVAFTAYNDQGYNSAVSHMYSKAYAELGTHVPDMPPNVKQARDDYKGAGYQTMNDLLRKRKPNADSRNTLLTDYLSKTTLPHDIILLRRLRHDFAQHFLSMADVGFEMTERGFMSTSLDPEKMKGWGPVTLVLNVPKGTHAAWVNNDTESEILLQRNQRIKVYEVDWKTNTFLCTVEELELNQ